jgi:hypothetical protein
MSETNQLVDAIASARSLRTRLVWLVGSASTGKTSLLLKLADSHPEHSYVNLNAALAKSLADESPESRPFSIGNHLSTILAPRAQGAYLVDNIEILFARHLLLPVVDRLKNIAQQATLVVSWPGKIEANKLIYGARNHPDYGEFGLDTPLLVDLNNATHNKYKQGK